MKVRISRTHSPVTNLGYGTRIGIWFQGCSIGCRGCVAVDTWSSDARDDTTVEEVMAYVRSRPDDELAQLDGITLSGGEPFDQPEALLELIRALRSWRAEIARPIDILCYSGHREERIRSEHSEIVELLDALIPEPFVLAQRAVIPLRGSANQRVIALTPLGTERYTGEALERMTAQRDTMQVLIGDGRVLMVGIPKDDDIAALTRRLRDRGVRLMKTDPSAQ